MRRRHSLHQVVDVVAAPKPGQHSLLSLAVQHLRLGTCSLGHAPKSSSPDGWPGCQEPPRWERGCVPTALRTRARNVKITGPHIMHPGSARTQASIRTIPLPQAVLDALGAHLNAYPAEALVFTTVYGRRSGGRRSPPASGGRR
jgi:hypothetical protein